MELWLVRHGETDWNRQGRFQGQADPPLNDNGIRQAKALAEELAGHKFAAIYSSNLQRAYVTAQQIADRLGLAVRVEPGLREVNQGKWEGMLTPDIQARYPEEWAARRLDPLRARAPGGESLQEVAARLWATVDAIVREAPGAPIIIVSHGFALATLICRANGHPLAEAFTLVPDNAHPHVIEWRPEEDDKRKS